MADTQTKILTVDTGSAVNSLKEYKLYLDNLKGSLLSLEKGTEEYNTKAQELKNAQHKLNEVMDIAKSKGVAVEGSYDNLVETMSRLKKEWRATGDAAERADLGKKILSLNDQLKDLDASTGNFQRNVGDYRNAFSDAFEKMLGPLGKMGTSIGGLARDVKGLVPLIKSVNSTAVSGLKGIKAAIASTGIGLLIIAVGELAANWEKVYTWITGVNKVTKELETAQDKITDATDEQVKNMGYQVQIMQAEGKTSVEILKYQVQEVKTALTKLKIYKELVDKKIAELEAHNLLTKALNGEYHMIKKLKEMSDESEKKITDLSDKLEGLEWGLKAAEIRESVKNLEDMRKRGEDIRKEMDTLRESAKKFVETINSVDDSDLTKVRKKYEEDLAVLEEYKKAKVVSDEDYEKTKAAIEERYRKERNAIVDADLQAVKEKGIKTAKEMTDAAIEEIERGSKDVKLLDLTKQLKGIQDEINSNKEKFSFSGLWKQFYNPKEIQDAKAARIKDIEETFDREKKTSEDKIAVWEAEMRKHGESDERYKELYKKVEDEKTKIAEQETNKRIKVGEEELKAEDQLMQQRLNLMQSLANGLNQIGALIQDWATYREQDLHSQVRQGKMSEAEARKEFKRIQKAQLAAVTINTQAGQLGAFAQGVANYKWPYGAIIGGAQATQVLLQGIMQYSRIKRTTFDGGGTLNNTSTPNMSSVTNEYTPTYVQNVQTNTELDELSNVMGNIQPVVLVSDINDAQNAVKVRDSENSF